MTQLLNSLKTGLLLVACTLFLLPNSQLQAQDKGVQVVAKTKIAQYKPWVISYEEAVQKSLESGRPIMLVFSGSDWCPWCVRLSKEVFATHEFAEWSAERVVKVEVDFPRSYQLAPKIKLQNEQLRERYQERVTSYPTVIFVNAQGKVIAQTDYDGKGAKQFVNKACMLIPPQRQPHDLLAGAPIQKTVGKLVSASDAATE